ncbi:hypothetical protein GOP47_0000680 [Adiantum capillus-veneris]|uniref:Uncharacterized protein n=1 Tax=Adiantum capillus-veneris TaxID=13818 RepID=A0A9D4VDF6_ADICA|nr:hypothetical protein GOP47_0000680 [Adiantum capillus-veneris]
MHPKGDEPCACLGLYVNVAQSPGDPVTQQDVQKRSWLPPAVDPCLQMIFNGNNFCSLVHRAFLFHPLDWAFFPAAFFFAIAFRIAFRSLDFCCCGLRVDCIELLDFSLELSLVVGVAIGVSFCCLAIPDRPARVQFSDSRAAACAWRFSSLCSFLQQKSINLVWRFALCGESPIRDCSITLK